MDSGHLSAEPVRPIRPLWIIPGLIAGLAIVAAIGALAGRFVLGDDQNYPDEWDPAVLDLAAFVEESRGLEWAHPVQVDFADEQEFAADLGVGELEPDPEYDAGYLGWFRALGLGSGTADLGAEQDTLLAGGVAAFYIPFEDRVVIPAGELTISQQATIVHELTHALQDQHFDIGRLFKTIERDAVFTALIEGDATRIENLWIASLPPARLAELETEYAQSSAGYEADVAGVTSALEALFSSPYQLGPPLAEILLRAGELDANLHSPPFTEEAVFDPVMHLLGDDKISDRPTLDDPDGEFWDEGQLGPVLLYLMLAEVVPLDRALNAVHGWGTDAYVSSFIDDRLCMEIEIEADSTADLAEMRRAFNVWAQSSPDREMLSRNHGRSTVSLQTCDPGPDGAPVELDAVLALDAAASVSWIALTALDEGLPPEQAHCVGLTTVGSFTLDEIADPDSRWWNEGLWDSYDNSIEACD
ncbi:MAG: hypothetical protein GY929_26620 [Actinomycetia bacterium]|nr:hypothetical protein [Actinomycetes bacterium]